MEVAFCWRGPLRPYVLWSYANFCRIPILKLALDDDGTMPTNTVSASLFDVMVLTLDNGLGTWFNQSVPGTWGHGT